MQTVHTVCKFIPGTCTALAIIGDFCKTSSSSSNTVQGSVLLPHYRTLEVRPGRIS